MPSQASKAAQATARDKERRENAPKLTVVPDPPQSKGDEARAAVVAELPGYQQAEYARLVADGTRHPTALAQARKLPDPAEQTGDIDQAAADLFAAFTAGQAGGAANPAETLAVTVGADPPKPPAGAVPDGTPASGPAAPAGAPNPPKPAAATPKQQPKPKTTPPPAPADGSCTRHIGTVATSVLGAGGTAEELVHDCPHARTNGHKTVDAAQKCAGKLLGKYPGGTTGTRPHPVRRDLNGRRLS